MASWSLTEILGCWGAALSTGLAWREIVKNRRATRPQLVAYITTESTGAGMTSQGPGQEVPSIGETRIVVIHNRGGATTTIHRLGLRIAPRWCPVFLLGTLGAFGRAPGMGSTDYEHDVLPRSYLQAPVLDPGKDAEVKVVVWEQHREALAQGRLMLNVMHTWARDRPRQIVVRLQG